jgi:curved DNA-binding protein CbpA
MKAVYIYWAKNHHPDVGGDLETFKRVNAAWDQIKQERGF